MVRRMSTVTPPRERARTGGPGGGIGDACRVIVLNDDHNTFDGVAFALARTIPGVTFERGQAMANTIHTSERPMRTSSRRMWFAVIKRLLLQFMSLSPQDLGSALNCCDR